MTFHDRDVVVTACGRLCLHRKRINISTVLADQKLGIKEVDEGIWLVSFMHYDLGYFDLEQKTLQPLDNPFGPKPVTYVSGTTSAPCRAMTASRPESGASSAGSVPKKMSLQPHDNPNGPCLRYVLK